MKFKLSHNKNKQIQIDREKLRKLGYIQELDRNTGTFSVFAISFSVISVLTGLIILYGFGVNNKGSYELESWLLIGVFQILTSICLGEIASCYPIAGGIYKWTSILKNNKLGWFNGCVSLFGWISCTAGINYGLSDFILKLFNFKDKSLVTVMGICSMIILLQMIINVFGMKIITKVNNLSTIVHISGVLIISIMLIIFSNRNFNMFSFDFMQQIKNINITKFFPALLMSSWTLMAFDAASSISEECINPTKTVPHGMILSVIVSVIFGGILLFGLKFAGSGVQINNLVNGTVPLNIINYTLGETITKFVSIILVIAMFSCGLAASTVTIRIIFSFSRDNGLIFSDILKLVSEKYGTPIFSIGLFGIVEIALLIIVSFINNNSVESSTTLTIITSLSTVGIYVSYAIVILCAILNRKKIIHDKGVFFLKKHGIFLEVISFLWLSIISVTMMFFYNRYTTRIFMGFILLLLVYYFLYMRKLLNYDYKKLSEDELLNIEKMRGFENE